MVDLDAVAHFLARHGRIVRVVSEHIVTEREPRHGGDDAGFHFAASQQMT